MNDLVLPNPPVAVKKWMDGHELLVQDCGKFNWVTCRPELRYPSNKISHQTRDQVWRRRDEKSVPEIRTFCRRYFPACLASIR